MRDVRVVHQILIHDILEADEFLQKLFRILHHLQGTFPLYILRLLVLVHLHCVVPKPSQQVLRGREHLGHPRGRVRPTFRRLKVLLLYTIQRLLRFLHQRYRVVQIPLRIRLLLLHIRLYNRALLRLNRRFRVFLLHLRLLLTHDFRKRIRLLPLRLRLYLLYLHLLLDDRHLGRGLTELHEPLLVTFFATFQGLLLLIQHGGKKRYEFEERFGRRVGVPTFLFEQFDAEFVDEREGIGHEFDDGFADFFGSEFDFREERFGDVVEGLVGPRLEPIDDCAVDERRELPGSSAHVPYRGKANRHVEILLDGIDEPVPAVFTRIGLAFAFYFAPDGVNYDFLLVGGVQFRDFSRTQQVVDVYEESFVGYLPLREEEKNGFFFGTAFLVQTLEIRAEVRHPVRGAYRNAERGVAHHEGRKFRQRLFSGTADTNQQRVTRRREHDTANSRHMLQRVFEKHQPHVREIIIILSQAFLYMWLQFLVGDLVVKPFGGNSVREIAENEVLGLVLVEVPR